MSPDFTVYFFVAAGVSETAVATGVVSLDAEGHVTTVHGSAERMLGLTAAQIQGRPVGRVFRSPEYAEIDELITDRNAPADGLEPIRNAGVEVVQV